MARRLSQVARRLNRIKGLPPDERLLMVRMGEMIDSAINNRGPANPFGRGSTRTDPRLPPVRNITAESSIRTVRLEWGAAESSILSHYEVQLTNLSTGETVTKIAHTNSLIFKSEENGTFNALIKSVGRNQTSSPVREISFTLNEDMMFLEGTKNAVDVVGTSVAEEIFVPKDYKVFIWGAYTLGNFSAGPSTGNPTPTIEILRGTTLATATTIQTITMFPENEDAANYNNAALGGITRPTVPRGLLKQTPQSVMFTPFEIPDDEADQEVTFWLRVNGRGDTEDVLSLSIVIWTASTGGVEVIPSPPTQEFISDPRKCVQFNENFASEPEFCRGSIDSNFNLVGNVWSIGIWLMVDTATETQINAGELTQMTLVDCHRLSGGAEVNNNRRRIVYSRRIVGGNPGDFTYRDIITIFVGRSDGTPTTWQFTTADLAHQSNPNHIRNPMMGRGFGKWHLWVFTFIGDGTDRGKMYFNGALEGSPTQYNMDSTTQSIEGQYWTIADSRVAQVNPPAEDNPFLGKIHWVGVWTVNLDADEITALYNSGDGADFDWRTNSGDYISAFNLNHWWQLGGVTDTIPLIGRDTGYFQFDGNIDVNNQGSVDKENAANISVVDVLDSYPGKSGE